MVNPFDKTFFNFLLGFMVILTLSLSILFFVNWHTETINKKDLTAKNSVQIKK